MNPLFKYDPEDMESLLLHKQFHELYPEEKEFVLRHMSGPEEYDSLRRTLLELHDASNHDEWLEPDDQLKRTLMAEFQREHRSRFIVWLNALFATPELPWYRRPAVQLALGSILIAGIVISLWPDTSSPTFAELRKEESVSNQPTDTSSSPKAEENKSPIPPMEQNIAYVQEDRAIPPPALSTEEYLEIQEEGTEAPSNGAATPLPSMDRVESDIAIVDAVTMQGNSTQPLASAPSVQPEEAFSESEATAKTLSKTVAKTKNAVTLSSSMADKKDLLQVLYTAR